MKNLTFSKTSWHYRLATSDFGNYVPEHTNDHVPVHDFCRYIQAVLRAGLILLLFGTCVLLLWYMLANLVLGLAFSLYYGTWLANEVGMGAMYAIGVGAGFLVVRAMIVFLVDFIYNDGPHTDGFIKNAYHSLKNRFCARITFIDEA